MSTTVRAVVCTGTTDPLRISDVSLPDPGPGQVRVRLSAAGVCHSDLSLANGTLPQALPTVLGHEGAGRVESLGPDITRTDIAPGQHVVLNWSPPCRECWFCTNNEPYLCEQGLASASRSHASLEDGTPVFPGLGTGAFAEATVVPAHAVLPLPEGITPNTGALLGCAALTGWGAVTNSAHVRAGESAAVIGLGGVGLATLQSLRLAGADPIIAVDVSTAKEELARKLGASHFVTAGDNTSRELRGITGGRGVDHAFEVVGSSATIRTAWSATRRGGTTTVVGAGAKEDTVGLSALEIFHSARTLRGCMYGACDPDRDIPVLGQRVRDGDLDLATMVTDEIGLDDIPEAFHRMREGRGGRSIIRFE